METNLNNTSNEEAREEVEDQSFNFWSDEGARLFNEILDEGSAYMSALDVRLPKDVEVHLKDEQCECVDPELCGPSEETLSPGEMELIFENSYVM